MWNWNAIIALSFAVRRLSLNRTNVELKHGVRAHWCGLSKSLNRTNVELKLHTATTAETGAQMLESNQCGIETTPSHSPFWLNLSAWIEPMWNWNVPKACCSFAVGSGLNRTNVELKQLMSMYVVYSQFKLESNQCGIETSTSNIVGLAFFPAWIEPMWNWNVVYNSLNITLREAWIEPMWNWNEYFLIILLLSRIKLESNQCGIETSRAE